jgi:hypothetical protein
MHTPRASHPRDSWDPGAAYNRGTCPAIAAGAAGAAWDSDSTTAESGYPSYPCIANDCGTIAAIAPCVAIVARYSYSAVAVNCIAIDPGAAYNCDSGVASVASVADVST